MENNRDCLSGYKHHLTDTLLHRMHERLYEICERERLYTVEIDQPTDRKVTDREYRAQQRGQKEKDAHNEKIRVDGYEPVHPNYETVKQQLRDAVDNAASRANTEFEFFNILRKDYAIKVNLKRGRYSYVHPDGNKPFTARSLGNAYSREAILEKLRMNREPIVDTRPEYASLPRVFLISSDLRLVVDLQSCVKLQRSFQPGAAEPGLCAEGHDFQHPEDGEHRRKVGMPMAFQVLPKGQNRGRFKSKI